MANIRLGDLAPDFQAESTQGTIQFHEWLNDSWAILFSHPADFTPVCTTELGALARYSKHFEERNTKVIAISVDNLASHFKWLLDINETQNVNVNFPIIADPDKKVAALYGMIHPNSSTNFTVRSVFVIAPDKTVKLIITYPASTGRNMDELLRVIDSLQLTAYKQVATPVNWEKGEEVVILPSITDEEANTRFPGFKKIKSYLRLTRV